MGNDISILYVDDEPINLLLFEELFKKKYNVYTANSGYEGLEELNRNPSLKVVISDMRMPGMDGIEFIERAKANYPNVIFYILTGYDISPLIQRSLESGLIECYFQKPFDMNEIDNTLSKKLGNLEP